MSGVVIQFPSRCSSVAEQSVCSGEVAGSIPCHRHHDAVAFNALLARVDDAMQEDRDRTGGCCTVPATGHHEGAS